MTNTLEILFAETLRDYLKTADAQTAGLPAHATPLTYLAAHERGDKARPVLTVEVERQNQQHPEIAELLCTFKIEINVARSGVTAAGSTTPETAGTWILALRKHLADRETLSDFFGDDGDLTESQRTGWQILLHHLHPYVNPEPEADAQEITYEQQLTFTLRVNEHRV